jgi:hypothetical protein
MSPWYISRYQLRAMLVARRTVVRPDSHCPRLSMRYVAIECLPVYEERIRTEICAGARHRPKLTIGH